jgi:hypothetical protein
MALFLYKHFCEAVRGFYKEKKKRAPIADDKKGHTKIKTKNGYILGHNF